MKKQIKWLGIVFALVLCACTAPVGRAGIKTIYLQKYEPQGAYTPDYRVSDQKVKDYQAKGISLRFEIEEKELKQLYPEYAPKANAPLIGVLFNREEDAYSIPATYVYALLKAGARVRILSFDDLAGQVDGLDGIVLTGGDFAWPTDMYFALEDKDYPPTTSRYAAYEYLARYAARRRMPLLGICAGMQAMSYVLTDHQVKLHESLSAVTESSHREVPATENAHLIFIAPDSRLAQVLKSVKVPVNSRHFQGVAASTLKEYPGAKAVAYSPDGVVEAIEFEAYPNAMAVQFHPEVMAWVQDKNGQAVFDAFVKDAQAYKKAR